MTPELLPIPNTLIIYPQSSNHILLKVAYHVPIPQINVFNEFGNSVTDDV